MAFRNRSTQSQGVLSRAGRGDGVICPRCKTFAPLRPVGYVCTSCGGIVVKAEIKAAEGLSRFDPTEPAFPGGHLGRKRSVSTPPSPPAVVNPVPVPVDIPVAQSPVGVLPEPLGLPQVPVDTDLVPMMSELKAAPKKSKSG